MRWSAERDAEDQLAAITRTWLYALGVPFDDATVRRDLVERARYPAIASLVHALQRWDLACDAFAVAPEGLSDLPVPFVALRRDDRYVLVTAVSTDAVAIVDSRDGPRSEPRARFLSGWKGQVVVAEADASSSACSPAGARALAVTRRRRAAVGLFAAALVAGLGAAVLLRLGAAHLAIAALALVGVVVSASLLVAAEGQGGWLRRVCTLGPRSSCASVLESPAARVGPVTMTDIGVVYFATVLVGIAIAAALPWPARATLLTGLAALSLLALPYTLFSIAYQIRLGAYCPLCLAIQGVLWAQALLSLRTLRDPPRPSLDGCLVLALTAGVLVVAWALARPLIARGLRFDATARQAMRLRRDPERVERLLPSPAALPPSGLDILEGDPAGTITLDVYSDLSCHRCIEAHAALAQLRAEHPRGLSVRHHVVNFFPLSEETRAFARELSRLIAVDGQAAAAHALARWFAGASPRRTALPADAPGAAAFAAFLGSAQASGLDAVPRVFVDGRQLPEMLELEDLVDWIDERLDGDAEKASAAQEA